MVGSNRRQRRRGIGSIGQSASLPAVTSRNSSERLRDLVSPSRGDTVSVSSLLSQDEDVEAAQRPSSIEVDQAEKIEERTREGFELMGVPESLELGSGEREDQRR